MEHDHVVDIDLEKDQYDQTSQDGTPSIISPPLSHDKIVNLTSAAFSRSCIVCRKTLLLSYFNCCAICLGVMECRQGQKPTLDSDSDSDSDTLPITEPPPSTSSPSSTPTSNNQRANKTPHCDFSYCRYTHLRPIMFLMTLCEASHFLVGLTLLNMSLYWHNFALLRFAGLLLLQWWQIFVLPRQWACGQSIVTAQLVAVLFMVWFYVDGSRNWKW
ncbi:hypothetical protein F5Y13DRAFT_168496 [Hypoxylon sp. FL1857]|nr:hypothetical protein F5Y13DRAFT_168496 [Hypoxylon sp. FL1857]